MSWKSGGSRSHHIKHLNKSVARQNAKDRQSYHSPPPHQSRLELISKNLDDSDLPESRCHCGRVSSHTLKVEGFLDAYLCHRHFDHLRQYLGAEKFLAQQEREDLPMFEKKSAKPSANPWLERVIALEDEHLIQYEKFVAAKARRDKLLGEYLEAKRKQRAPELSDSLDEMVSKQTRNSAIEQLGTSVVSEAELAMRAAQRDWADPLHNELCAEFRLIEAEHEARQAKASAEYAERVAASWRDREAAVVRAVAISEQRAEALGYFRRRDYEEYVRTQPQPQPEAHSLPPKPKTLDNLLSSYGQQSA